MEDPQSIPTNLLFIRYILTMHLARVSWPNIPVYPILP